MFESITTPASGEEVSTHDGNVGQVVTERLDKPPSLIEFLRFILPSDGFYCYWFKDKDGKPRQGFTATIEELADKLLAIDAAGLDGYFACASYKTDKNRKAENAHLAQCLWGDLDAGPSKPYPTAEAACAALDAFCNQAQLPLPTVVYSGGGIHCYWRNDTPLDVRSWKDKAGRLAALAARMGLCFDKTRTEDISSILRPPYTHNYKLPGNPRIVECPELLSGALPELPEENANSHGNGTFSSEWMNFNKNAGAFHNFEPSFAAVAVTQCKQLAHFRDMKGVISEPLWYAGICVLAHCADGEALAHQWSSGHKNYTERETAAKLIQGRTSSGPTSCEHFRKLNPAGCQGCPFNVTSPIVLGRQHQTDWPDPKPIRETLRPVALFDAERQLPEVLRGWVMDEANRMPCPPDFIAAGVMVALGSLIGARCAVKPKELDDWLVVPNLWGGVVALPSAKKSPAIGAALKPLDQLAAKAMEKHQNEMGLYEAQKTAHEAREKDIKNRIIKGAKNKSNNGGTYAQELIEHRQQAPTKPNPKRYKTNDTTVEALGELLRDNPAGLSVLRDELVGLIASWDKEGREGDRAFFLEAWNGNASYNTDRIGRGSIFIPNLCASIFGGIQPDKLIAYLEQAAHALANDGMLQRFQILVYPDPCPWEWRDRTPNKQLRDHAYDVFDKLAATEPVNWGGQTANNYAKFPHFFFSPEAQKIFIQFSAKLHNEKIPTEETPIIAQHLAKFDKLFPALALILHLVECAATGQRGPITKEAALRAQAWCDYLETHARRCYGLLADRNVRAAQALAHKISQGELQDGFTARDVSRKKWRNLTTAEIVEAALDTLEDEGWVISQEAGGTGPGGGRRTFRYFINPKAVQPLKPKDDGI